MNRMLSNNSIYNWISAHLHVIVLLIFVIQPLMDILSFFMDKLSMGNTLTLLLRLAVLAITALLGFAVSKNKKIYYIFAGICLVLLIGHVLACLQQEYLDPVGDISNYIRVIQMPLFAICFISFMKANERTYDAVIQGLIINFVIITVSIILSVLTGTYGHTYVDNEIGVLGWFNTSNAQSAVMSLLTPILAVFAYRKNNYWILLLTIIAAFSQLYFLGTRLAFMAMAVTLFGLLIVMLINKSVDFKALAIIAVCFGICCATIKVSPMYRNQTVYSNSMNDKQGDANVMMSMQGSTDRDDWDSYTKAEKKEILSVIYEFYNTKYLCRRYGIDNVLEAYDYTYSIQEITATRHQKIIYCKLLMEEQDSVLSKLFGMELSRMIYAGNNYDVENDFHGIYFLYGWTGLLLIIGFILYFVYLIVKALIKDFRKYFTFEAGAFGMAFCLALIYAYSTAGVLRRPNSSFYLSIVLAVIYYLTVIKKYDDTKGLSI